jgi:periplasmic protein TonB
MAVGTLVARVQQLCCAAKVTRRHPMKHIPRSCCRGGGLAALAAAVLAGCTSTPLPPAPVTTAPAPTPPSTQAVPPAAVARWSSATNARAYRNDAAAHLYGLNGDRIYKGRLPPMLYAVGVLQVEVDGGGNVRNLNWMRAPRHAPEVVAEIERTVRAAAPFPAPARMGRVVYTDTWLWHKSGRFQLDTLTEGQD